MVMQKGPELIKRLWQLQWVVGCRKRTARMMMGSEFLFDAVNGSKAKEYIKNPSRVV